MWLRYCAVCLSACLLYAQTEKPSTVSGTVSDAMTGATLRKMTVVLLSVPSAGQKNLPPGYSVSTDAIGMFKFENIVPGDYKVSAWGPGYLENSQNTSTVLHLVSGETVSKYDIKLTRQSVITGRVLDENGDAVRDVRVMAISQFWVHGHRQYGFAAQDTTDDRGQYRLANLFPGRYYVRAMPESGSFIEQPGQTPVSLVTVFYPEVSAVQNATMLDVHAGDNLDGINFLLHPKPSFHIRGVVTLDDDPDVLSQYTIAAGLPGSTGDLLDYEGEFSDAGYFDI